MAFDAEQLVQYLNSMPPTEQAFLLGHIGHQITVSARGAYERNGPGVTDPRLLRDLNEITHRLFPQIAALSVGAPAPFSNEALVSWLSGEEKPSIRSHCHAAIERGIYHAKRT